MSNSRRTKILIARVFATNEGIELLDMWYQQYVEARTFSPEPFVMAAATARKDFVTDIQSTIREVATWES